MQRGSRCSPAAAAPSPKLKRGQRGGGMFAATGEQVRQGRPILQRHKVPPPHTPFFHPVISASFLLPPLSPFFLFPPSFPFPSGVPPSHLPFTSLHPSILSAFLLLLPPSPPSLQPLSPNPTPTSCPSSYLRPPSFFHLPPSPSSLSPPPPFPAPSYSC